MTSIESSGRPLVFRVENSHDELPGGAGSTMPGTFLRTVVRALVGMQKEAAVTIEPDGSVWRLVSDEGPYLNGTDLAPFPLAFFAAGMQFS
ncbi:MAG: OsmC family peroxiredoxin, partial [Acidimicrobiia bacterium]